MHKICDFSVIHLERSKERSANVSQMQARIPNLHIHKAIDGKKLTTSKLRVYQKTGTLPLDITWDYVCQRPFTKEHLAIWLSHVTLWEHLLKLKNPAPFHIIFEDDAIIQPDFFTLLDKYASRIAKMDFAHLYVFPQQVEKYNLGRKGVRRVRPGLWGTAMLCHSSRVSPRTSSMH